jgi:structural maintenance of chromosomes protein 6
MRETYGDLITVERVINQSGGGGYKIFNENGKLVLQQFNCYYNVQPNLSGRPVSNKREDLNRILAKMNLQVDNPVCILNQETAKNFLHSSDPKSKYLLFERATQMDQMTRGFAMAEEELARSKSCLKEKISVNHSHL